MKLSALLAVSLLTLAACSSSRDDAATAPAIAIATEASATTESTTTTKSLPTTSRSTAPAAATPILTAADVRDVLIAAGVDCGDLTPVDSGEAITGAVGDSATCVTSNDFVLSLTVFASDDDMTKMREFLVGTYTNLSITAMPAIKADRALVAGNNNPLPDDLRDQIREALDGEVINLAVI